MFFMKLEVCKRSLKLEVTSHIFISNVDKYYIKTLSDTKMQWGDPGADIIFYVLGGSW